VFRNADGSVQGKDITIQLSGTATSVRNTDVFTSASAYPNPSSEYANISFGLKATGSVTLKIFDALGNEVKTLVNGETLASNTTHIMQWDATNNAGAKVSSGAYFYRLIVDGVSETGSVVINR
jgi:flagellar hook assembly protein FlgD